MTETTGEKDTQYQRVVSKGPLPFQYIKVKLEFEDGQPRDVGESQMKALISGMIKEIYGEVGCSLTSDVLKYSLKDCTAILRVTHKNLVKVWSSLTLCSSFKGEPCAFRVLQTSPHLMALAVNSRDLDF
ncbi:ribonuclease P protein subunit p14-like [Haliotis rubra]|uniref:ribonuclease P protein subunit p14-like n=1 Tax=Haliotis rubra TaxID=36100 RepID=UPI001EE5DB9D|nr:ribonuclease P protein subunit p14-like [Haliotis rubra]XP_046568141.1 ribonuclease P protein subunit p14-like [Haliotis rubra]XP_046568142.1 ribonuclease P protein subunit p14-like [Haliotis rubra]XP_046568143.1 ribonuclease P protein subunit p14-like [Haliotis rubra]XP_046568144.1 ribonuclease P protein subunit p14-like [Haliotis rubra]XP_046568145.1 ribonuclease P protein subunit p14-like [Haliotis rubra]